MRKPDRFPDRFPALSSAAILSVVSAVALCAGVAGPGVAQVYNPGNTPSGGSAVASDQNTFGGAVAPAEKDRHHPAPGYKGVMPGYVAPETPQTPDKPVAEEKPKPEQRPISTSDAQPQMSFKPGYKPPHLPTAEELRHIAALAGTEITLQTLPADLAANVHISKKVYGLVSGPQPRIDGMLPAEFTTKRTIDELMQRVNDQSLSDDDRKKVAAAAIQQLSNWGVYVRSRDAIPPTIYQALGVPGVYVEESHEAMSKSDARVQDAIKQLREIEQQQQDQ